MDRRRLHVIASIASPLLVCAIIVAIGCSLQTASTPDSEPRLAFPHRVHLNEDLQCADCHKVDATTGKPTHTSYGRCKTCHEGIDQDKPAAQQVARFYQDGKAKGPFFVALDPEVRFDHAGHTRSVESCASCHGDLAQSDSLGAELRPSMTQCVTCHEARGAAKDCATCHREVRADRQPGSHTAQFLKTHGLDLNGAARAQCSLCHTEASCAGCHLQTKPQSHTNQFRRRGHGLLAAMDRKTCQTCHQSDFCVRCHESTQPSSHTASFGSPRDRHCLGCHLPVTQEPSCVICHKSTASHALAPPKPPDHSAGMNCRQCHGLAAPLPHADNGADCNACHK